jgi:very-short-patch-repair endonuclease
MRKLFTAADVAITHDALRWGVRSGRWVRVVHGVYGEGSEPPSQLDRQRALVLSRHTVARGTLAGVLLRLDSVNLDGRPTRADRVDATYVVAGVPCASAAQVLIDLAATMSDDEWEQALESALRKRLTSIGELESIVKPRQTGTPRIRRVLARRPPGAPPTESLLETLALQLARDVPALGELTRQHEVRSATGSFIARVDLCKPEIGVFFELDGQQHRDQPVYDAARETAVVAATGWLPGRFTWHQITRTPRTSQRLMAEVAAQAATRRR